ncbi:MAG TPA: Na+/H+ antiporter subunit D [Pseudonocardia sp.]|nr:Na+/H+ antiporter subunit D [Pseudonocardia sp.]
MRALATLPVVLPLAGAAATLLLGRHTAVLRVLSGLVHAGALGCAVALLVLADRSGPQVVALGGWPAPLGIALVADRLSALLLVVALTVLVTVLVYAISQSASDPEGGFPATVFHPAYLVLTAGVCLAFLAGDLFTMFVGFEMLLTASYVLVTIGGTAERVRAGSTYILVSLTGSILFLLTVAVVYAATGTVNLADLAVRLNEIDPGLRQVLSLMLLVVFAIKAAAVPLHAWLPDSYPSAPSPVTAVFAGLLTKVGVYAMLRTQSLLFGDGSAAPAILALAVLTMIVGMLGALAQTDLNRMLSFVLVGHIGFMLFGLSLFSVDGLAGAIFYTMHHILAQAALFLVSGILERQRGTVSLDELGGVARTAPAVAVLFALPAMSLSGIPPFSGFLAKVGLLVAAPGQGAAALAGAAVVVVASLLTVRAMAAVWTRAFWGDPTPPVPDANPHDQVLVGTRRRVPTAMLAATGALTVAGLAIVVVAGPVQAFTERAATDLLERDRYVEAVLGDGGAGDG